MAILETAAPLTQALWPQGDIRDPLGVWGFRHGVTGDASGGSVKVIIRVPAGLGAAYVYTCYSAHISKITGAIELTTARLRLLTNWPNVDRQAGVQAYATHHVVTLTGATVATSPVVGPFNDGVLVTSNDRFLLLFDPRPTVGAIDIVEFELGINTLAETYSFEAYGYYWDRSILQAPGGPRHPGSN